MHTTRNYTRRKAVANFSRLSFVVVSASLMVPSSGFLPPMVHQHLTLTRGSPLSRIAICSKPLCSGSRSSTLAQTKSHEVVRAEPDNKETRSHAYLEGGVPKDSVYMWALKMMVPNNRDVLLRTLACILMVFLGRLANIMTPIMYKKSVDTLMEGALIIGSAGQIQKLAAIKQSSFTFVALYIFWKLAQTFSEFVRSYLWIPVQQSRKEAISTSLLSHLHSQSIRFHISSKTGEILQIMERGASGVDRLMDAVPFRLVPQAIDVFLAGAVMAKLRYPFFGFLAFLTVSIYVVCTLALTQWRTKFWRAMVEADQVVDVHVCRGWARSLFVVRAWGVCRYVLAHTLMFLAHQRKGSRVTTVKYFAAEKHELTQYRDLMKDWRHKQKMAEFSLMLLNMVQQITLCGGLGVIMCLSAGRVLSNLMTVGDFVMINLYVMQIVLPLQWLGSTFRMVEESFVDAEKMLRLLEITPEVEDRPHATPLKVTDGTVSFKNVSFSYDGVTPVLKNISFEVQEGRSLAIVGESGGGKSTIARLLFRLYDVSDGSVCIDGVDVRDVTQASVREAIGVVPQETVLFNDAVMYNVKYGSIVNGSITGSDEQVVRACQAAQLHDKVLKFPDGYETRVGEKGLRLSGGEKQRVGIARTVIGSRRIVVLDEATSALDSTTEKQVQQALDQACAGRTSIVISHRLSSVVSSDEIIVLEKGRIVEKGRHEELLNLKGAYAKLWEKYAVQEKDGLELIAPSPEATEHVELEMEPASKFVLDREATSFAEDECVECENPTRSLR